MGVYSEFRHYSVVLGCNASRLSMWNNGEEYFAIIPMNGTGKQNREMRENALQSIENAIERGDQPGVVMV